MHEPDIAPLARRLAEENNVDWRRLSGTGEGGRVVERDVLGYLARVMAGDEAVDPTPEPVPDGMVAWPEGDVSAYRQDADGPEAPDMRSTLDDDLFLFDDPLPGGRAPAGEHDDDLFVRSDDPEPDGSEGRRAAVGGPVEATTGGDEGEDGVWLVGDDAAEVDGGVETGDAAVADDVVGVEPVPPIWTFSGEDDEAPNEPRLDELPDLTEGDAADDAASTEDHAARGPGGHGDFVLPELFAGDAASGGDGAVPADDDAVVPIDDPAAPSMGATVESEVGTSDATVGQVVHWVRHGQLWRRRFDARALRQVASDAAAVLDVPPTTVVALLLARAASRAGVATGPVDVWRWRRAGADRIRVDVEATVRDAVHRIETRGARGGAQGVSLVVADLGDLDVDEGVLHLEVPVLALGRAGNDGSWLSLAGDELDGGAAAGLAWVADLLTAPVRLLV